MFSRIAGLLGIAAGVLCWSALFVFGALRPSYAHTLNAVSELGVVGTPYAPLWNLIGFITPGLMLTIAGGAIAVSVSPKRWRSAAFWLLLVSGLGFAGTGVFPAEMKDGAILVTSASTRGHFIASLVHGIAWIAAVLALFGSMRKNPDWRQRCIPSLILMLLTIIVLFVVRGTLSDAIVQRMAGAIYFLWYFLMSLRLIQIGARSGLTYAQGE